MSSRQISALVEYLHDFDHANHQVLAYTIGKKHYWRDHGSYRSWMGVFSNGAWKYSKKYKEVSEKCPR
jgi:hypothetical protein